MFSFYQKASQETVYDGFLKNMQFTNFNFFFFFFSETKFYPWNVSEYWRTASLGCIV
jgi:hypothetical protein